MQLATPFIFAFMRKTKWLTALAAIVFLASCFFPWVVIESKDLVVSGVDATGTRWGKPGYMSLLFISIYLVMNFIQTNWAHRTALLVAALNLGWVIRNFFLLSICQSGECPARQPAFIIYAATGLLLLLLVLIRKVNLPYTENDPTTVTD